MTVVTTVLLGLVYPLVITGLAQVLFPDQANGQLIERDGQIVGSRIIGQPFSVARLLPVAAVGGRHRLRRRRLVRIEPRADQQEADRSRGGRRGEAAGRPRPACRSRSTWSRRRPRDWIRTSARPRRIYQVPRVARERGVSEDTVRQLVDAHIEGRQFGLLGEPVVNVLLLNLALDDRVPMRR